MKRTLWTTEQVAKLIRLYPTSSPETVAAVIGRPLGSVYNKAHDLGIKNHTERKARPKLASKPCLPASKPVKAALRGPAYQEGEPIFTAKTRYVIGPSPQQAFRTNTFAE